MSIVFDGKAYALKKKELLRAGATLLREKGIIPHMATILIGDDSASHLYVDLKKKFIEDLGCQVDIYKFSARVSFNEVKLLIDTLNKDSAVHGIMVQFPLPEKIRNYKLQITNLIAQNKDVDGLKENSKYLHPTSKAVIEILKLAEVENNYEVKTISVVGATGMVGRPLVKELRRLGYHVYEEANAKTDVVISATGKMNLITPDLVKVGAIVIDVGSPFADVSSEVYPKLSFYTPVPGGVGPVTITCLAENLLQAAMENDI